MQYQYESIGEATFIIIVHKIYNMTQRVNKWAVYHIDFVLEVQYVTISLRKSSAPMVVLIFLYCTFAHQAFFAFVQSNNYNVMSHNVYHSLHQTAGAILFI